MQRKIEEWKEISRETIFSKYGRELEKVIFELPGGTRSDYYIKKEAPFVSVLALTKDQQVILAKQFRPGPKEILFELPGGRIDPGEKAEEAAARELLEETGYQGNIKKVGSVLGCAYSCHSQQGFVAMDCEKVAEPQQTESEFCEVELMSLKDFREIIKKGKLSDVGGAYQGLDYLNLL